MSSSIVERKNENITVEENERAGGQEI